MYILSHVKRHPQQSLASMIMKSEFGTRQGSSGTLDEHAAQNADDEVEIIKVNLPVDR